MKKNLKKILLTGTAIVFVSVFTAPASAAPGLIVSTTSSTANPGLFGDNGADGNPPGAGSAGVQYSATASGINFTVDAAGLIGGGAGGNPTADGPDPGGDGGVGLDFNNDNGTDAAHLTTLTNAGEISGIFGSDGANGNASSGGNGGDGSAGVVDNANFSSIINSGSIFGGSGGFGGSGDGSTGSNGGAGGAGGAGIILSGSNSTILTTGAVFGGFGAFGGNVSGANVAGNSSNGGDAIDLLGNSDTLTVSGGAVGGAPGDPGSVAFDPGGTAGRGGNGGNGILSAGANETIIIGSGAEVLGSPGSQGGLVNGVQAVGLDGTNGAGIKITGTVTSFSNQGTVGGNFSAGPGIAIDQGGSIATFTNAGGTISSSGSGQVNSAFILGSTTQGALTLNGTIENVDVADDNGEAVAITAAPLGTITNTGAITSTGADAALGVALDFGADASFANTTGTLNGRIIDTGDANVVLTNAGGITGGITLDGNGNHSLTNNAGGTITGNVALSGSGTNTLTVAGGTITGNVAVSGSSSDLLIMGGGTITGSVAVTLATLDVTANGSSTGALTNHGVVNIGAGKILTAASETGDGTIETALTANGVTNTIGSISVTGAVNISAQSVFVNLASAHAVALGGSGTLLVAGTAGTAVSPAAVTDNSYLYNFATQAGSGGTAPNLYLVASQAVTYASATSSTSNANLASILLTSLAASPDPQINAVQNALINAPTKAAFNNAIEATKPTVDQSAATSSVNFSNSTFALADTRLASLRDGTDERDAQTGVAAGDISHGLSAWGQVFGQHVNQNAREGVAGYDANTWGGAAGIDTQNISDKLVAGVAFSYGHTDANSDNANTTKTAIDSYQATLYGNYNLDRRSYVDAMAAYGWNQNDTTRHDVGGVTGLTADGSFHASQIQRRRKPGATSLRAIRR